MKTVYKIAIVDEYLAYHCWKKGAINSWMHGYVLQVTARIRPIVSTDDA